MSGTDTVTNSIVFPESKLQTLDRRVGKDNLFLDSSLFEKSVDDWNGIPVFFQKDGVHPSDEMFDIVKTDPEKVAEMIGGKLVGTVSNARIEIPGGARLMASLNIDSDEAEIQELWEKGLLFPSTGFIVSADEDMRILTPPEPNHVLLFPMEEGKVVPGDFGAYVHTQRTENETMTDENTKEPSVPQVETPCETTNSTDSLEAKIAELTQAVGEIKAALVPETNADEEQPNPDMQAKDDEIAALKQELETIKAELEALKTEKLNSEFDSFLQFLPAGMTATDEQVKTLRNQYENDPHSLVFSVLNAMKGGETEKAGTPYNVSNTADCGTGIGDLAMKKIQAKRNGGK